MVVVVVYILQQKFTELEPIEFVLAKVLEDTTMSPLRL